MSMEMRISDDIFFKNFKITMNIISSLSLLTLASSASVDIDFSSLGFPYEGIGALSGGGGVTRLLVEYPTEIQSDIYDLLFLPKKGASLQLIKVELAGDSISTEGTEKSHSRFRGDLNCSRGYEWNVLVEAKKRNPAIRTYALSWAVPSYIGNYSFQSYYSQDNIDYHLSWLSCARNTWGVDIDYLGIWNEKMFDSTWIKSLRHELDRNGYQTTRIVAADLDFTSISTAISTDPELALAIDIVGVHYPYFPPPPVSFEINKPLYVTEMWNLTEYNDFKGSLRLARDVMTYASWGARSSIVWCMIYSWFAILPYSHVDSSNAGSGHALMTAAEPWSGHYELSTPLGSVAHFTQFADPGWFYLNNTGPAMNLIPGVGYISTMINTYVPEGKLEFSIVIETSDAPSQVDLTLNLHGFAPSSTLPLSLYAWKTSETELFVQIADAIVNADGTVQLALDPMCIYSFTTTTGQGWATPSLPIPPSQPFPFPYFDDFNSSPLLGYSKYWSDLGGVFETALVPPSLDGNGLEQAYCQVIEKDPGANAWEQNPAPYTILGNGNSGANLSAWTDYQVSVRAAIDPSVQVLRLNTSALSGALKNCSSFPASYTSFAFDEPSGLVSSLALPGFCLGVDHTLTPASYPGIPLSLVTCSSPEFSTTASILKFRFNASSNQVQTTMPSGEAPAVDLCLTYMINKYAAVVHLNLCALDSTDPLLPFQQWTFLNNTAFQYVANSTSCLGFNPLEQTTRVQLMVSGRMSTYYYSAAPPGAYNFIVYPSMGTGLNGSFALKMNDNILASGNVFQPISPGTWYTLTLAFKGNKITAYIDGVMVTTVLSNAYSSGMVAIGSGFHKAWFDNVAITNLTMTSE
jgi:Glycosyl hydrolase family 59